MNKCTVAKSGAVGETSSKYGYPGGGVAFIADLEAAKERSEKLWSDFVEFMKSHNVDPRILRELFTRYYEEYLEEV
jgi:hypothetical protein